jgi:multidrug efflux pump subunit AcrB
MNSAGQNRSFFSPFTINIIFVVLIIIGGGVIPLLSLQLNPTRYLPSLSVTWRWPEAPVRVVEQEVTTVLEGVLSTVSGVSKITSSTYQESGRIILEFDKNTDLRTKRFEVASLLKESAKRLPEKVSYPLISMNMPSNTSGSTILSYQINGNANSSYIAEVAEEQIKPRIALINGVYSVGITGASPMEWEILYDQNKLTSIGINSSTISSSINNYLLEREAGGALETSSDGSVKRTYITLTGNRSDTVRWCDIPVTKVSGRIIHLTDVAHIKLKEQKARSYYRINGLNTVNLTISAERNVNNIKVADAVKNEMERIKNDLPAGFSIRNSLDNTTFIKEEISKNIFRTILSVILLLLFVLVISREIKYLLIIAISLFANIFIAFIFYYLFKLEIHLYSLAGITVSFGIIINNTIVMTDHIRYHRNRKVGISLLAATLTTIGALVVIFFLDEASKLTLSDFAAVVIINLSVSLAVALFFIPSLLEKIKLVPKFNAMIVKRKRRVVKFSRIYLRSINFIIRFRAAFIVLGILIFGLPFFYLPDSLPKNRRYNMKDSELTKFERIYNRTLGNRNYVQNIKPFVNKSLGGTFRLFSDKVKNSRYYYYGSSGDVSRTQLSVNIGLSEEGLTIEDINYVCLGLENMLSPYEEIDLFTTSIYSLESAYMTITFKPEYDLSIFPFVLKMKIEDYMNGVGSYHASVYGVGKAFSNQVSSDYIRGTYSVAMKGYNYDELYRYSESIKERLIASAKGRIKEVYLLGGDNRYYAKKNSRYRLELNKYYLTENNSNVAFAFTEANRYSRSTSAFQNVYMNGFMAPATLKALQSEEYDFWTFNNSPIRTPSGVNVKMKDFSKVNKEITDNTISREDQQYVIYVTYDFIGNSELGRMILERNVDETASFLPLGYTSQIQGYNYSWNVKKTNYYLLFLIVLIIYVICSILLESLRQPLTVISLIPFSFIGVFVTFSVFNITPDEGVFAAMILLCGIVVNATLYILNDYNILKRHKPHVNERILYLKAFNGKIIPIFLTKLSAIIGVLPFLLSGKDEKFWFSLAAGTIGGLVFSMIGLFVFQPIMLRKKTARLQDKQTIRQ